MTNDDIKALAKAYKIKRTKQPDGALGYSPEFYEFMQAVEFFIRKEQELLVKHLVRGLIEVKTRPGNESAWIAQNYLDTAKVTYGLKDE